MKIHIHANCQAISIAGMLNEVHPNWKISFYEIHTEKIIEEIEHYYQCVQQADIVIAQPIHEGYRNRPDLSLNWLQENIRLGSRLIVFPSMHFGAHQLSWEANPFPGFDLLAAHFVSHGFQPLDALRQLLSPDLLSDDDIEREISISIAEMKRREIEDNIDIKFSPILENLGRRKILFHTSNHPTRETAVFVANLILKSIGSNTEVLISGRQYQSDTHIPPLPSVTRFLKSNCQELIDPRLYDTVRMHTISNMPIENYYRDMVARLASIPPEKLLSSIANRWPTIQILQRLAASRSEIPGIERWLTD